MTSKINDYNSWWIEINNNKTCPMCEYTLNCSWWNIICQNCDLDIIRYESYCAFKYQNYRFNVTTGWNWFPHRDSYYRCLYKAVIDDSYQRIPTSMLDFKPTPANIKAFIDSQAYLKYLLLTK